MTNTFGGLLKYLRKFRRHKHILLYQFVYVLLCSCELKTSFQWSGFSFAVFLLSPYCLGAHSKPSTRRKLYSTCYPPHVCRKCFVCDLDFYCFFVNIIQATTVALVLIFVFQFQGGQICISKQLLSFFFCKST